MAAGSSSDTTAPATETVSTPQTDAFNNGEGDQSSNAAKRGITEESRSRTNLEEGLIETRASRQAGLVKRARAHQYKVLTLVDSRSRVNGPNQLNQECTSSIRDTEQNTQDDARKHLSRLDLFNDLQGSILGLPSEYRNRGVGTYTAVLAHLEDLGWA
ncbi:hypothetical protein HYFRA_00013974 [Hymenoscyphus fraxineus]|uniref:Uncharacterized protein n=1 Tax=Hymenoscyphus fraxineus TaxID=746836 RepID=A0A9N9LC63_9HELO|nr:hypothetical protein HYFRA_00013974 [Hymenoscyphus fraxineus]